MTKVFLIAAALSLAAMAAASAQTQPAPVYDQSDNFGLSNAGVASGPYLKGTGGYSASASSRFGDSPVFGGGVGWRFTPWLRADATFDYRSDGTDHIAGGARFRNWAAMLNGYIDVNLPFIRPLIPYVGAGAGIDQNKVGGSTVNVPGAAVAHLTGSSKNQFAWQAVAGLSWYLTPTLAVDAGYRYFYGGRAESGSASGLPVRGDYSAHEIVGGLRWGF
jgi:opacity protein-like surface antigen